MENEQIPPKAFHAYIWGGSSDGPMRSLEIDFSHPVKIGNIYHNNSANPKNRTLIINNVDDYENPIVKIRFAIDDVDPGAGPLDGIWIHFSYKNKYTEINKFTWFSNNTATGTGKIAPPDELSYFNNQFIFQRPDPPLIKKPHRGAKVPNKNALITGTSKKNSDITIFANGEEKGTTKSDDHGEWSVVISTLLSLGKCTFTAKLTDFKGNESKESVPVSCTIIP